MAKDNSKIVIIIAVIAIAIFILGPKLGLFSISGLYNNYVSNEPTNYVAAISYYGDVTSCSSLGNYTFCMDPRYSSNPSFNNMVSIISSSSGTCSDYVPNRILDVLGVNSTTYIGILGTPNNICRKTVVSEVITNTANIYGRDVYEIEPIDTTYDFVYSTCPSGMMCINNVVRDCSTLDYSSVTPNVLPTLEQDYETTFCNKNDNVIFLVSGRLNITSLKSIYFDRFITPATETCNSTISSYSVFKTCNNQTICHANINYSNIQGCLIPTNAMCGTATNISFATEQQCADYITNNENLFIKYKWWFIIGGSLVLLILLMRKN